MSLHFSSSYAAPPADTLAARRQALEERKAYLIGQIDAMAADLSATPDPDWEDRAVDLADDEVQETLSGADAIELRAVDAALARIAAGTYGTCARCGEPIEADRLDLLPQTPFCAACARR
jgi:RNA polymerase-binding transcription factor DksA